MRLPSLLSAVVIGRDGSSERVAERNRCRVALLWTRREARGAACAGSILRRDFSGQVIDPDVRWRWYGVHDNVQAKPGIRLRNTHLQQLGRSALGCHDMSFWSPTLLERGVWSS